MLSIEYRSVAHVGKDWFEERRRHPRDRSIEPTLLFWREFVFVLVSVSLFPHRVPGIAAHGLLYRGLDDLAPNERILK